MWLLFEIAVVVCVGMAICAAAPPIILQIYANRRAGAPRGPYRV